MTNKIPDHIEEYFAEVEGSKQAMHSRELFNADNENIDLKTDLSNDEINLIAGLKFNDLFLKSKGLKPLFMNYYINYMRLKVSKDRKSREEFVNINKQDSKEDVISMASNLSNISGAKNKMNNNDLKDKLKLINEDIALVKERNDIKRK